MVKVGDVLIRNYSESNYIVYFDRESGMLVRISMLGQEPFWNVNGPELVDISITNYCEKGCGFCYRASNPSGNHMQLQEYSRLMTQAKEAGVLQVALGGGNPNQHPDFVNILKVTREYGMVPSYTTNGQGMTEDIYIATKKYCGALAVSWYEPHREDCAVIEECEKLGIKINIHFLLNLQTLEAAIQLLSKETELLRKVNAVIFLNYKPIHSDEKWCLKENELMKRFLFLVKECKECKVGFDSCMISYLTDLEKELYLETIEFCEAARFSAFIAEDSILYPCSFMRDTQISGINLREVTLKEGWQKADIFVSMRKKLREPGTQKYPIDRCRECEKYLFCHGGCQMFNINRCRKG